MRHAIIPLAILSIAASGLIAASPLRAGSPGSPSFLLVETGARFSTLQRAVDAIGDGTGTILVAPGIYNQCAVQSGGNATYRAEVPGRSRLSGRACEGKAALVLRGRAARVEGLIFERIAVEDGNGAGIRLERGDLSVDNSLFRDSQQGILANNDPAHAIRVDKSSFVRLGTCDNAGGCAHSIYAGDYGLLSVTRSRFAEGTGGHYLKSRARRVSVLANRFDDVRGRQTNYMIDLSNGSVGEIRGNTMVQGRDKDNYSAFIALGAEGRTHRSAGLAINGNSASFAPGVDRKSAFIADWTGEALAIGANRLGAGIAAYQRR